MPCSRPTSTSDLISSLETCSSRLSSFILSNVRTEFVDNVRIFTKGENILEIKTMTPIEERAIFSDDFSATLLGISSPKTNVIYDSINVIIIIES